MYLFTVKPLADKIVAAKQRGVAVRVILDPDEAGNTQSSPRSRAASITWKNASTALPVLAREVSDRRSARTP